jgi:hypothetical protein
MTRFIVPQALVAAAATCCALACSDPVPSPVGSDMQATAGASPIGGSAAGSTVAGTDPTVGGGGAASGGAGGASGSGVGGAVAGQCGASGAPADAGAGASAGGSSSVGAGGVGSSGASSVVDLFNGTERWTQSDGTLAGRIDVPRRRVDPFVHEQLRIGEAIVRLVERARHRQVVSVRGRERRSAQVLGEG